MTARGMTLIETMLAIGMTALVGTGISGMMHVLSNDVAMQHEVRAGVVRAALVQARLSAYVGRSRCLLDLEGERAVLWLQDSDGDDAVHADEIRWLHWSEADGDAVIQWIEPLDGADLPTYDDPAAIDWWAQYTALATRSNVQAGTLALATSLASFEFREVLNTTPNQRRRDAMQRRRVEVDLGMTLGTELRHHRVGESIRLHRQPSGESAP